MDILEYVRVPESSNKMHRFRELLFELSARLISVPVSEISSEIEKGLELTGCYWDFDFLVLAVSSNDGKVARPLYTYQA